MNSRLFNIVTIISLFFLVISLGGCKEKKKDYYNPMVQELDDTPDNAVFARLDKIVGDSMYVTQKYTDRKFAFGFSEALADDDIKGSITIGHEYSIYPHWKDHSVKIAINVTELSGKWYYDMEHHRGFDFGAYGSLGSINNEEMSFREWKLLNGKLYLYYVEMDQENKDRHEYFVYEAEIEHLDNDHLQIEYDGNSWDCQRMRKPLKFKDVVKE